LRPRKTGLFGCKLEALYGVDGQTQESFCKLPLKVEMAIDDPRAGLHPRRTWTPPAQLREKGKQEFDAVTLERSMKAGAQMLHVGPYEEVAHDRVDDGIRSRHTAALWHHEIYLS
jgi:hypothetical protein